MREGPDLGRPAMQHPLHTVDREGGGAPVEEKKRGAPVEEKEYLRTESWPPSSITTMRGEGEEGGGRSRAPIALLVEEQRREGTDLGLL
jgi:hypothetical protein